jgi:hypothetical protein
VQAGGWGNAHDKKKRRTLISERPLLYAGMKTLVIEHLINFDRQTLRCGIAHAICYFDCKAIYATGRWLTADNAGRNIQ